MSDDHNARAPTPNPRLWDERVTAIKEVIFPLVMKVLGPLRITPATRSLSEHPAIWLRDSVVFRAGSLGYHVDLLRRQYLAYRAKAGEPGAVGEARNILHHAQRDITYLADDVLFNAVSLLDYVANLTGYVFTRNKTALQWSGMAKAGRDVRNPMSSRRAAQMIAAKDREWVNSFYDVRATIIHNKALLGDGSQSVTFTVVKDRLSPTTLSFPMDRFTVKKLKFLRPRDGETCVELVDGTEQLALATLETATSVLHELLADVGGPVQPAKRSE